MRDWTSTDRFTDALDAWITREPGGDREPRAFYDHDCADDHEGYDGLDSADDDCDDEAAA